MTTPVVPEARPAWLRTFTRWPVASWLLAGGLVVALVGVFLPWVSVSGGGGLLAGLDALIEAEYGSTDPNGLNFGDGVVAIILILLVAGAVIVHGVRDGRGKALPVTGIVLTSVLALVGMANIADINDTSETFFEPVGGELAPGIGLYLVAIGGIGAIVGSSMMTAKSPRRRSGAPDAVPGADTPTSAAAPAVTAPGESFPVPPPAPPPTPPPTEASPPPPPPPPPPS